MKSARQRTGSEGAKALAQTLHNLGFPGKVSPSSLQWVFEDPQTKGVMEWLAAQDLSSLVRRRATPSLPPLNPPFALSLQFPGNLCPCSPVLKTPA